MKIGIDISQLAYANTGVAHYLQSLLEHLLRIDSQNQYIFFFSSLRGKCPVQLDHFSQNVTIRQYKFPPTVLDFMWNKLHIYPLEWFVGDVDIFITSDWTEPPSKKAKKLTILYDLIVYTYPQETDRKIIETQKRKLAWALKESSGFLCISESTKKDAEKILGIAKEKLFVVYPGV